MKTDYFSHLEGLRIETFDQFTAWLDRWVEETTPEDPLSAVCRWKLRSWIFP